MNIAYYPGCSGQGTSAEYDCSTRAVCAALGMELMDVPDWSCCGSTPAHAVDHGLSGALSGRNLVQAATLGAVKVTTPCPSCLGNLKAARYRMHKPEFMGTVRTLLGGNLPETAEALPETYSVLQLLLEDIGVDAIRERVRRPLKGLRIAPYYGCLMSRPAGIMQFDDPEHPTAMDKILDALGVEVIDFPLKTECCGAAMGIPKREVTARLCGRLLRTARNYGADAIAVACPLCQMNLDLRQPQAEAACRTTFNMPVLYFTQLMGLAFGLSEQEIALEKLCVSPAPLTVKLAAAAREEAAQAGQPEQAGAAKPAQQPADAEVKS